MQYHSFYSDFSLPPGSSLSQHFQKNSSSRETSASVQDIPLHWRKQCFLCEDKQWYQSDFNNLQTNKMNRKTGGMGSLGGGVKHIAPDNGMSHSAYFQRPLTSMNPQSPSPFGISQLVNNPSLPSDHWWSISFYGDRGRSCLIHKYNSSKYITMWFQSLLTSVLYKPIQSGASSLLMSTLR